MELCGIIATRQTTRIMLTESRNITFAAYSVTSYQSP